MDMSIIVPTYNRKDVVCHAILALVNQSMTDYEVIVSDDGSNDGTKEAIESLSQKYVLPFSLKYTYQEKNGFRAAKARNEGIKLATGKIIVFLDQDMIVAPNTLMKFKNIKENTFCFGLKLFVPISFYLENISDNVILNDFEVIKNQKYGLIPATLSNFGAIHKSDILKVDGFDEDFDAYGLEDTELIDRLHDLHFHGYLDKGCWAYHIEHEKHNGLFRKVQDLYHHKRNHKTGNGTKVK